MEKKNNGIKKAKLNRYIKDKCKKYLIKLKPQPRLECAVCFQKQNQRLSTSLREL